MQRLFCVCIDLWSSFTLVVVHQLSEELLMLLQYGIQHIIIVMWVKLLCKAAQPYFSMMGLISAATDDSTTWGSFDVTWYGCQVRQSLLDIRHYVLSNHNNNHSHFVSCWYCWTGRSKNCSFVSERQLTLIPQHGTGVSSQGARLVDNKFEFRFSLLFSCFVHSVSLSY